MSAHKTAILTGDFGAQHAQQPYQILKTVGYEVDYVSPGKREGEMVQIVFHWEQGDQTYREKGGRPIVITEDFENVNAREYDGLVIPGARAPEYLSTNEEALALVRDFDAKDKPIVAMCHGPILIAAADIVDGVRTTGHTLTRPWLEMAGAEWVEPTPGDMDSHGKAAEHLFGVVTDGNIITAPLKVEFPNVMREFLRQIEGADELTINLAQDNRLLTPAD